MRRPIQRLNAHVLYGKFYFGLFRRREPTFLPPRHIFPLRITHHPPRAPRAQKYLYVGTYPAAAATFVAASPQLVPSLGRCLHDLGAAIWRCLSRGGARADPDADPDVQGSSSSTNVGTRSDFDTSEVPEQRGYVEGYFEGYAPPSARPHSYELVPTAVDAV